jgi:hypothetical protein
MIDISSGTIITTLVPFLMWMAVALALLFDLDLAASLETPLGNILRLLKLHSRII